LSDWINVGTHSIRVEQEIAFIRLCGKLSVSQTQALLAICQDVHEKEGRICMLFDGTKTTSLSPEVRRTVIDWSKRYPITAVANFGGGLPQRALATLAIAAIRLLSRTAPPQTYEATEAAARAWLEQYRPAR